MMNDKNYINKNTIQFENSLHLLSEFSILHPYLR